MAQVNLLRSLPKPRRNIAKRAEAKDPAVIAIARQYGEMYWDGPREYGYGGYRYDGRWRPVARDIIDHYGLKAGMKVLDVGCGKGFLVKDLMLECPGLEAFGLDVSLYAVTHAPDETIGRLHLGTAERLPFPDDSFDCVLSLNTIHNFPRPRAIRCLAEIERVCKGSASFVVVDSYHTPEQKEVFESWVLTAEFHDYPDGWLRVFEEAGYSGDWDWTVIE
ncbi:class I SAM-dependent methyltransferase [Magnetospirillum sp. UT-4]|uniref:class I SAM-dependent methyltransferase n=1 Tax=Magnetospirillum sp. UT-4 TaxID=2681467 RepID=UPI001383BA74|nr:class I SAM-dependent methyltransferase [Magnetospirillum sp. UT-4]CAA7612105.1 Methyltransferase type 11 [Magnetospirillum sp. UT-4]